MQFLSSTVAIAAPIIVRGFEPRSAASAQWFFATLIEGFGALGAWALYKHVEALRARRRPRGLLVDLSADSRRARRRLANEVSAIFPSPISKLQPGRLVAVSGHVVLAPGGADVSSRYSAWVPVTKGDTVFIQDESDRTLCIVLSGRPEGLFDVGGTVFVVGELQAATTPTAPARGPFRGDTQNNGPVRLAMGPSGLLLMITGSQADAVNALAPKRILDTATVLRYIAIGLAILALVSGCVTPFV